MKILPRIELGNPVLRKQAIPLSKEEIASTKIQTLIKNMHHTLLAEKLGIGLAAPQVGQSIALSVVAIRPTSHRPHVSKFDAVIINPRIVKTYGNKKQLWEGCLSAGESGLFGKVARFARAEVFYLDEHGAEHTKQFEGLQAQVMQHEIDHLNGVLFVDHVKDPGTYMTLTEYKKQVVAKPKS